MMIARRCFCSAISVLFQTTRPRSVLVSHKQKNSSLLSSIDRSHFFFVFFFERFFLYQNREDCVSKAVLFFVLFKRNFFVWIVLFVRDQKRKIFVCKFVHVVSPPFHGGQPRIQNQRKLLLFLCLWHKISVLSSSA